MCSLCAPAPLRENTSCWGSAVNWRRHCDLAQRRGGAEPNVMNENTIGTRYKKTFLGTGSYRIPAMDQGVHPLPSGF